MQSFRALLTSEDQKVARRTGRVVLIVYTSTALALTAAVIAHATFKHPTSASAPLQASTQFPPSGPHAEMPNGLLRAGSRF